MAEEHDNYIKNRATAYRLLAMETGIAAAAALLLIVGWDATAAKSAALGGLILVAPNALFVSYAFRRSAVSSAANALRGLYVGEAAKLALTILLFGVCFAFVRPLNAGVLFATYAALLGINLAGTARVVK